MGPTLVIARGSSVFVLSSPSLAREFARGPAPSGALPGRGPTGGGSLPPGLLDDLAGPGGPARVVVCGRALAAELAEVLRRPVEPADPSAWHAALRAVPLPDRSAERTYVLARARSDLDAVLRSPEEVLVSLAREADRLERQVGREERAAEAFVAPPGTALEGYVQGWARTRGVLREHHRRLIAQLEDEARRTVPNLSAVLGARTAARLVAAAGGVAPLARISSSRLQLLGSRRRPNPERGPRYGAVYLADGAEEVPPERRAAYLRSVAALAAIAARADAWTHATVAPSLVRRRDARREQLRRRRR